VRCQVRLSAELHADRALRGPGQRPRSSAPTARRRVAVWGTATPTRPRSIGSASAPASGPQDTRVDRHREEGDAPHMLAAPRAESPTCPPRPPAPLRNA